MDATAELRFLMDALPAAIARVSAGREILSVNRLFEDWFVTTDATVLGKPLDEVLGSATMRKVEHQVTVALGGDPVTFDMEVVDVRGVRRYVRSTFVPHSATEGEAPQSFVAVLTDITETKIESDTARFLSDASRLLSSSLDYEETLASLAHLAVPRLGDWCGIDVVLASGHSEQVAVAHVDPAKIVLARELRLKYPPDPDAPTGLPAVIRSGRSEIYEEVTDDLIARSVRDPEQLKIIRDVGIRSVIIVPLVTRRSGALGALTLVLSEGSRRYSRKDLVLAEALALRAAIAVENARLYADSQEAIRQRDSFMSVASHELKTPLTALQLHVSGLLRWTQRGRAESLSAERMRERLVKTDGQLRRLTSLIDQLLDVTRISAGKLDLEREASDLCALVRDVVSRFAEQATNASSPIQVLAPDEPIISEVDRNRVDQVLTNLLSNAIKYGAGKPIEVCVERKHEVVTIRVEDGGIGIAEEDQPRIFERFVRASSVRNYGGMGLGLWISKQIVDAHGGSIRLASHPGEGASFVVHLPLVRSSGGSGG